MGRSEKATQTYDSSVPSPDPVIADARARRCAFAGMNAELAAIGAAAIAARHERLCAEGSGRIGQLHGSMAATYRRVERVHRTSALRHRALASRLVRVLPQALLAPELLVAVARTLGAGGAALTLLGTARYEESAIASDATATLAQEMEFVLGEGPAHDAAGSGGLVVADEEAMSARWPHYSLAMTKLGVHTVTAAPLCLRDRCFGMLTAFNTNVRTVRVLVVGVTSYLVETVLYATSAEGTCQTVDDRTVVHQATGMIAARLHCPVGDALAVLRARAFAENEGIGVLARRIVDRELVFE